MWICFCCLFATVYCLFFTYIKSSFSLVSVLSTKEGERERERVNFVCVFFFLFDYFVFLLLWLLCFISPSGSTKSPRHGILSNRLLLQHVPKNPLCEHSVWQWCCCCRFCLSTRHSETITHSMTITLLFITIFCIIFHHVFSLTTSVATSTSSHTHTVRTISLSLCHFFFRHSVSFFVCIIIYISIFVSAQKIRLYSKLIRLRYPNITSLLHIAFQKGISQHTMWMGMEAYRNNGSHELQATKQ